ncbi:MAG: SDR family oxidoreductase [Oscillospiraceae bacterium]|nr:SDR family oxidoreductase [Oscillospiraceae bacterium]
MDIKPKYSAETVLITGSSSGIGYALAEIFAKHGCTLILSASHLPQLEEAARELSTYHVPVSLFPADLAEAGAAEKLYQSVKEAGFSPDILVNNAGFGLIGPADQLPMSQELEQLTVNILSLTALCKCFLPDLYRQGRGKILNVASTGAFQPGPYTASYFASKAYVYSYSRALHQEAKAHGVQVCTLCPGSTRTDFFRRAGVKTPALAMDPKVVAEYAYHSLMAGRAVAIPGLLNRLVRLVPAAVKLRVVGRIKGSASGL